MPLRLSWRSPLVVVLLFGGRLWPSCAKQASFDASRLSSSDAHRWHSPATVPSNTLSASAQLKSADDEESPACDWQDDLSRGVAISQTLLSSKEGLADVSWLADSIHRIDEDVRLPSSKAIPVPASMKRSEDLLQRALHKAALAEENAAPQVALQLYSHAMWLAERSHAEAAERRFRRCANLARENQRSILASHSLARLGYFLVLWNRHDEARHVVQEAHDLSPANALAMLLHGILERQVAGADAARLQLAEDLILSAGEQPSDSLEEERHELVADISFWRQAVESPWHCFMSADVAKVLVCLTAHGMRVLGCFFSVDALA